jgi:hypothetical protein
MAKKRVTELQLLLQVLPALRYRVLSKLISNVILCRLTKHNRYQSFITCSYNLLLPVLFPTDTRGLEPIYIEVCY